LPPPGVRYLQAGLDFLVDGPCDLPRQGRHRGQSELPHGLGDIGPGDMLPAGVARRHAALLTHLMWDEGAPHGGISDRHPSATAATQPQALQESRACAGGTCALEAAGLGIVSERWWVGLKRRPRDVAQVRGREHHLPVRLGDGPYGGVPVEAATPAHAAKHQRARIARMM
jgi:hypothetical protein